MAHGWAAIHTGGAPLLTEPAGAGTQRAPRAGVMSIFPLTVDVAFGPKFGSHVSLAWGWSVGPLCKGGRKGPEIA
jgi:hypothetical protein